VEVQVFERHNEWSRSEAEAYHMIFRYPLDLPLYPSH
jgi:hypothetical protein